MSQDEAENRYAQLNKEDFVFQVLSTLTSEQKNAVIIYLKCLLASQETSSLSLGIVGEITQ